MEHIFSLFVCVLYSFCCGGLARLQSPVVIFMFGVNSRQQAIVRLPWHGHRIYQLFFCLFCSFVVQELLTSISFISFYFFIISIFFFMTWFAIAVPHMHWKPTLVRFCEFFFFRSLSFALRYCVENHNRNKSHYWNRVWMRYDSNGTEIPKELNGSQTPHTYCQQEKSRN